MSSAAQINDVNTVSATASTEDKPLDPKLIWNKDISDFFSSLDSYEPTIPVPVTQFYLSKAGVNAMDPRVAKLVSLATDKFIADIIFDAKQFSQLRQQSQRKDVKRKVNDMAETLQFQDVVKSLKTRGISVRRPNGFMNGEA